MLGVMMLLSFAIPLAGALAIRRYAWLGAWAGVSAIVAMPVLYKLATGNIDPMGWGFALVLVFVPAAAGAALGSLITYLRRARMGAGEIKIVNIALAISLTALTLWGGLAFSLTV